MNDWRLIPVIKEPYSPGDQIVKMKRGTEMPSRVYVVLDPVRTRNGKLRMKGVIPHNQTIRTTWWGRSSNWLPPHYRHIKRNDPYLIESNKERARGVRLTNKIVKQNVKLMTRVDGHDFAPKAMTFTYEHTDWLEEGTVVKVDCQGTQYYGEITYDGKAYDGRCKAILEVVAAPTVVVCV